jgi:YidC/Oxa1 family membrane protein insertase
MEKKELTMEVRLLIAFVLMGLVIVWQYSMRPAPNPAPTAAKNAPSSPVAGQDPAKNTAIPIPPPAPSTVDIPGAVQAGAEETFTVETEVFRVKFSNRGGVVRSWILKSYKDHAGQPLELVNLRALDKVAAPFALVFKSQAPTTDLNTALYKMTPSEGGREVRFEFSDGHTAATKTFKFGPSTYLVDVSSEVVANGIRIPHELAWRGGFGDATVANPVADQHALYFDLSNSKLKQVALKEAKDGPVVSTGRYSFAGLEDKYFAGVFLSSNPTSVELSTFSTAVPGTSGADEQRIGAGVGGEGLNQFTFFAGPKDSGLLGKIDPKLEQLIDWGTWFGFIAKPLFLVLQWVAVRMTHNYGWAIVLVTVGINMVLFPLRFTSMKSSKKMQALQPQIQAINEKYKSLPMKDPKKADQQSELMDLYKKNGVNPVGGCLPMVHFTQC